MAWFGNSAHEDRYGGLPGPAWIGAIAMVCVALGIGLAAPAFAEPGQRYRRLDAGERVRAVRHAERAARPALAAYARRALEVPVRSETLLVERHRGDKGPSGDARRLVDVYVYDYDADHLCKSVVDLDADRVDSVTVVEGVQLPLTESEVARALDLVFGDAALEARLRAAYRRVSQQELVDRDLLRVSGFTFRADSMPGAHAPVTDICGRHRCAQLLLRTPDEVALELPIVDLSANRVLESHSFGINRAERAEARRRAAPPAPTTPTPTPDAHDGHDHEH